MKCQRCPVGQEKPATRTLIFGLGDTRWRIELCEPHGWALDREIGSWGRLGEELPLEDEKPMRFGEQYMTAAKRASELRSRQAAEDRMRERMAAETREQVDRALESRSDPNLVVVSSAPPTRGVDGKPWWFTEHARERLQERAVDIVAVLWAATDPTVIRPGKRPGLHIHERAGVKAVVNEITREIITVA